MMSAAKIQPFHFVKITAEFFFYRLKGFCKIIRILFTERVKMQSIHIIIHLICKLLFKMCNCHTETRTLCTWIIDRMIPLCGTLRVNTDSHAGFFAESFVFFQLGKRIKNHVIADFYQFLHILFFICRSKYMVFFSHFLFSKTSLKKSACRCSADILTDQRVFVKAGKGFLCKKDFTSGILFHFLENGKIFFQLFFIYDIARCF